MLIFQCWEMTRLIFLKCWMQLTGLQSLNLNVFGPESNCAEYDSVCIALLCCLLCKWRSFCSLSCIFKCLMAGHLAHQSLEEMRSQKKSRTTKERVCLIRQMMMMMKAIYLHRNQLPQPGKLKVVVIFWQTLWRCYINFQIYKYTHTCTK